MRHMKYRRPKRDSLWNNRQAIYLSNLVDDNWDLIENTTYDIILIKSKKVTFSTKQIQILILLLILLIKYENKYENKYEYKYYYY